MRRELDFEPSPSCRHEPDLRCRRCTPVYRRVDAHELPDFRKLAAIGGYVATRHRGLHGVDTYELVPRVPDESGEVVTYRIVVERVA